MSSDRDGLTGISEGIKGPRQAKRQRGPSMRLGAGPAEPEDFRRAQRGAAGVWGQEHVGPGYKAVEGDGGCEYCSELLTCENIKTQGLPPHTPPFIFHISSSTI